MANSTYSHLSFSIPKNNAGQIVEVAYAADNERGEIVSRSTDHSDDSVAYAVTSLDNLVGEFEPWNREPQFADDGLWSAIDER